MQTLYPRDILFQGDKENTVHCITLRVPGPWVKKMFV